jgi:SHS2 domain-containing protein
MKRMVNKPSYELLDHTADFGIHVFGDNVKNLFQNAALALMEQLVETADLLGREERQIVLEGNDRPDLMVNWLREILYLWTGEECLVQSVRIESITEKQLKARVWVDPFSPDRHKLISEIKAVTYHQVQVYKTCSRWEANVIFDI